MQKTIQETIADQPVTLPTNHLVNTSTIDHHEVPGAGTNTNETNEQSSTLVKMIHKEAQTRGRQTFGVLSVSTALMIGIIQMVPRLAVSDSASFGPKVAMCLAMLFGIGGVMAADLSRRSYRSKKSLTDHIARVSAKTNVAALVRALKVDGKAVKNIAKTCLIDILPQLNAGDAELLGEAERDILNRILAISPNDKGYRDLTELWSAAAKRREIDFRVAILKAYEQVGGARELAVVARLTDDQPVLPRLARELLVGRSLLKMPSEIAQAAAECLPYLQLRANEEVASRQLLRASGPNSVMDRSLLRPAASEPDLPPEQLLRASQ